jgi:sulfite reductase beta subunit-like hemoprotein
VLVDRVGIDAFREMIEEELRGDWVAERDFSPQLFIFDEEAAAPKARQSATSPNGDAMDFERFVAANVQPQRQAGYSTVEVKIPRGDLTPEQFRGLAQIMRDFERWLRAHHDPAEPGPALGALTSRSTGSGWRSASSSSTVSARGRSPTS